MTDGVARELQQAEARLAQLQGWLEGKIATRHSVALRDVLTTAIEVGRLRALALTDEDRPRLEHAIYNVYSQDDSLPRLDIYHVRQIADAVVAALAAP